MKRDTGSPTAGHDGLAMKQTAGHAYNRPSRSGDSQKLFEISRETARPTRGN